MNRLKVQVLSSLPITRLRSSMDLEHRSSKPEVASSSLAGAATRFGVVQPAGRLTLNQETKVRILSPKPILFQFLGVPQMTIRAGLGIQCSQV